MNCVQLTSLKTEMFYLSTEQIQPGKRQCNVPMCLNPDLEGQPLRMRGELSHKSDYESEMNCVCQSSSHPAGAGISYSEDSTFAQILPRLRIECMTYDIPSLNMTDKNLFLTVKF